MKQKKIVPGYVEILSLEYDLNPTNIKSASRGTKIVIAHHQGQVIKHHEFQFEKAFVKNPVQTIYDYNTVNKTLASFAAKLGSVCGFEFEQHEAQYLAIVGKFKVSEIPEIVYHDKKENLEMVQRLAGAKKKKPAKPKTEKTKKQGSGLSWKI